MDVESDSTTLEGEQTVERALGSVSIDGADVVAARLSHQGAGRAVDSEIARRD